jgi:chromosome segregation ATPase
MILQTSTYLTVLCGNNAENRRFSAGERFEFLKTVHMADFCYCASTRDGLFLFQKSVTVSISKTKKQGLLRPNGARHATNNNADSKFHGHWERRNQIQQPRLVLVEGKNSDSPSSISNGAGKSTIYDALHWAFWGKTKRGIGGDDVVSNKAKKDCQVSVEFMVNGTAFTVLRTRKSAEHGNALRLWSLDGDCPDDAVDLTKGTTKETQAFLEETVKMSELTFGKVAHFGQGDVKNFAELSDAELKMVFEQALGLEFLSDTLQKVKLHKAKQEAVLNALETTRARLERECDHLREKKIYLDTAEREMKTRRAEEATRYDREAATIEAEIAALTAKKSELASVSTEAQAKFKVLSAQLATLNKTRADLTRRMNDARSALAVEKATADAKLKEAMKALEPSRRRMPRLACHAVNAASHTRRRHRHRQGWFANRARVASAERKEHLASIGHARLV